MNTLQAVHASGCGLRVSDEVRWLPDEGLRFGVYREGAGQVEASQKKTEFRKLIIMGSPNSNPALTTPV